MPWILYFQAIFVFINWNFFENKSTSYDIRGWLDIRFGLDKQMNAMQRNASCQIKSFVYLSRPFPAWTVSWIIQMSEYPPTRYIWIQQGIQLSLFVF